MQHGKEAVLERENNKMTKKLDFVKRFFERYPDESHLRTNYPQYGSIYSIAHSCKMTDSYARTIAKTILRPHYGVMYEFFLENSDLAYSLQAAKAQERREEDMSMSTVTKKENQNNAKGANNMNKKELTKSDLKVPELQRLAKSGKGISDVLSMYHVREAEFNSWLKMAFGRDDQGRLKLLKDLAVNEDKKVVPPASTSTPAPAPALAKTEPRTLAELRVENELLNKKVNDLEGALKTAQSNLDNMSKVLEDFKTKNIKNFETTLSNLQTELTKAKESQKDLINQVNTLKKDTEKAIAAQVVTLKIDTKECAIIPESKIDFELNTSGWEAIRDGLMEMEDDSFTLRQLKLVAQAEAIVKNHPSINFKFISDEKIGSLLKK